MTDYFLQKPGIYEKDSTVVKHPDDGNMDSRIFSIQACIWHTYTAGFICSSLYAFAFMHRRNGNAKIFSCKKPEKQLNKFLTLLFSVVTGLFFWHGFIRK
jgi:hypothetical protein